MKVLHPLLLAVLGTSFLVVVLILSGHTYSSVLSWLSLPPMPCSHRCRRTRAAGRRRSSGGHGRQHPLCNNFFIDAGDVGLFFVYVHATPGSCPDFPLASAFYRRLVLYKGR